MYHRLVLVAAPAFALGLGVTGIGMANAATDPGTTGVQAGTVQADTSNASTPNADTTVTRTPADTSATNTSAAKTKIKTFVEVDKTRLTGTGRIRGWAFRVDFTEKGVLSPKLGEEVNGHWSNTFKHQGGRWHYILPIGGHTAYRSDDGQPWKTFNYSDGQLAAIKAGRDPMHIPPLMFKLRVARHVGRNHWRATGSLNQLRSFTDHELNLDTATFKRHGYKRLTIDLWLDSRGRPTKITVTGTAQIERASLTETFTNYDRPLTIKPPKI